MDANNRLRDEYNYISFEKHFHRECSGIEDMQNVAKAFARALRLKVLSNPNITTISMSSACTSNVGKTTFVRAMKDELAPKAIEKDIRSSDGMYYMTSWADYENGCEVRALDFANFSGSSAYDEITNIHEQICARTLEIVEHPNMIREFRAWDDRVYVAAGLYRVEDHPEKRKLWFSMRPETADEEPVRKFLREHMQEYVDTPEI